MGEGEGGKRDGEICPALQGLRKPFVASDHKHQIADGLVTMFAKPGSKLLGGQTLSGGVQ